MQRTSYPAIVQALDEMPDETVIEVEIFALDESGGLNSTRQNRILMAPLMMLLFGKDVNQPIVAHANAIRRSLFFRPKSP
jgi:hypothetical protein